MNFVKTLIAGAAVAALAGLSTAARAEDDVRLALKLDVLRLARRLRLRQGQGLLQGRRHQSRHPLRQRLGLGEPPGGERRQPVRLRLLRLAGDARLSRRAADFRRRDRRDGHGRHAGAARRRRQDGQGPQGQDHAHHGQRRREHVLPARAEERRPDRRTTSRSSTSPKARSSPATCKARAARSACSAASTTSRPRSRPPAAPRRSASPIPTTA